MSNLVPLTIGFSNLAGEQGAQYLSGDTDAISPIFARTNRPPPGKIPHTPILFAYAWLNDDGTMKGTKFGIRKLIEMSSAKMLVLGLANTDAAMIPVDCQAPSQPILFSRTIETVQASPASFAKCLS
jgi:hypothetical protein